MTGILQRRVSVTCEAQIPSDIRETPIGDLIRYHNLGADLPEYLQAKIVVIMCMDHRKNLRIPDRFAYMLRTPGARITNNEFKLSYAIGVAGVRHVALIAHTQCGMQGLQNRRSQFIAGMVEHAGWSSERAKTHFDENAPFFAVDNAEEFVRTEANRLREVYPGISFVAMVYLVEDKFLYLLP